MTSQVKVAMEMRMKALRTIEFSAKIRCFGFFCVCDFQRKRRVGCRKSGGDKKLASAIGARLQLAEIDLFFSFSLFFLFFFQILQCVLSLMKKVLTFYVHG